MNAKKTIKEIIRDIQQDPKLAGREKILVILDRECDSMLEDAYLLPAAGGTPQQLYYTADCGSDMADEAVIRMTKDGDSLVAFHETRTNSRNHRPNGIRVSLEDLFFPCVVFCNNGSERLTVEGNWVAPGDHCVIQETSLDDPEVQEALDAFCKSPAVLEGVEEVRRQMKDKQEKL